MSIRYLKAHTDCLVGNAHLMLPFAIFKCILLQCRAILSADYSNISNFSLTETNDHKSYNLALLKNEEKKITDC